MYDYIKNRHHENDNGVTALSFILNGYLNASTKR